jgi:hypothetical protein
MTLNKYKKNDNKNVFGTSTAIISMCCNGKRKTAKRYIWKKESIN